MCAHHRGPVDSPFLFPGLDTHSEYPWVPMAATLGLPFQTSHWEAANSREITLVNQITHNNQPVLIYQLFQNSRTGVVIPGHNRIAQELHKLLMPKLHPRISDFSCSKVSSGHQKL